jgi:uncharacterized radical SAM superfamily Fe-S cluster-containing enzyme
VLLHRGTSAGCCKIPQVKFDKETGLLTQSLKELRQSVLNNERNAQCENCWKIDDAGGPSLRRRASQHFNSEIDWESFDVNQPVRHVEISFSNKCQMMCAYCHPAVSSMWQDNISEFSEFKSLEKIEFESDIKIEDLVDVNNLQMLQVTGGEPMLEKSCVDFLKRLEFKIDRQMSIVTNLSYGPAVLSSLLEIIERHPTINVYVSLDEVGDNPYRKYFNWTLWNTNFNVLADNLKERRKKFPKCFMMIKSTLGITNYDKIQGIIEYVLNKRRRGFPGLTFDVNPLAHSELTSLQSGVIDTTKIISLPASSYNFLSEREKATVMHVNQLIQNSRPVEQYKEHTIKFLSKYNATATSGEKTND